jgi:hypothetical protein
MTTSGQNVNQYWVILHNTNSIPDRRSGRNACIPRKEERNSWLWSAETRKHPHVFKFCSVDFSVRDSTPKISNPSKDLRPSDRCSFFVYYCTHNSYLSSPKQKPLTVQSWFTSGWRSWRGSVNKDPRKLRPLILREHNARYFSFYSYKKIYLKSLLEL